MRKKIRSACTTHSFFLPGQLGPGYIFGKSQFCEAFCNNHFKKSRLACTEDHFMVTGRTNLRTQTAQWLFESSGSAYTRRDFSTKSIVSRARDCHLLGSRILRISPRGATERHSPIKGGASRARDCHLLGSGTLRIPPRSATERPGAPRSGQRTQAAAGAPPSARECHKAPGSTTDPQGSPQSVRECHRSPGSAIERQGASQSARECQGVAGSGVESQRAPGSARDTREGLGLLQGYQNLCNSF